MKADVWKEELRYHSPYPRIALYGSVIAAIAVIAITLSGLGSRWGWWYFRTGFMILGAAIVIGLVAAAVDLWSAVAIRGNTARHIFAVALAGTIIGFVGSGLPALWIASTSGMPSIHDVTTDMNDPPQFVAIMPLRKNAINPATYGGSSVAARQQAAYPQVRPLVLPLAPSQAFPRALEEARSMGWTIVDADPAAGRIEATAETFWFGFKDDIVVRIRPDGEGSRIDVRSVSRVGLNDRGTNARRVMKYLVALGMKT